MIKRFGIRSNMIKLIKSNFSAYRIIIILLLMVYEINCYSGKYKKLSLNETLEIIEKDIVILFLIPVVLSIFLMFVTYIKDKIEKTKVQEAGYYRDIIEECNPVELSYIDDCDIEIKKDIVAALLQLQLKKRISFDNDKITILNDSKVGLSNYEKTIFEKLLKNEKIVFDKNFKDEFKKDIKNSLADSNLLIENYEKIEKYETLYQKIKKVFLIVFMIFVIFFASGSEELLVALFKNLMMLLICFIVYKLIINKNRIWKPKKIKNKKKINPLINLLINFVMLSIFCLLMNLFIDTKNYIWLILDIIVVVTGIIRFFKNLDLAGAIVLQLFIVPIILAVPLFGLAGLFEDIQASIILLSKNIFTFAVIASIAIEFYLHINTYILTDKAKEIKIKLMGIKLFLRDYSNMKHKDLNEINLWDEYIIYSVILNENKKVRRKLLKMLEGGVVNVSR